MNQKVLVFWEEMGYMRWLGLKCMHTRFWTCELNIGSIDAHEKVREFTSQQYKEKVVEV